MPSSGVKTCALRSEEHTSELQSHDNIVCRLLLEKKIWRHSENAFHHKEMQHRVGQAGKRTFLSQSTKAPAPVHRSPATTPHAAASHFCLMESTTFSAPAFPPPASFPP